MTHTCPVHGNPLHADGRPLDGTQCAMPECWARFGLTVPGVTATARKPLPVCPHLSAEGVRVPGSSRNWRRCAAGFGSTLGDDRRGLVCGCATPTPGVWRQGRECGPACPGFPKG